jgi:beta-glucanase (GH16 family)
MRTATAVKLAAAIATLSVPATAGIVWADEARRAATRPSGPERAGWVLTWHDEFDAPRVDTTRWEVLTRRDNHNQELQHYVPEQATIVGDGVLRITATDEPLDGKAYRSARLESWFTQRYGRFECRAKLPATQGMWPAFWLLPRPADWPHRGEIDVLEGKGSNPSWVSAAFHFADPQTKRHRYVTQEHRPRDAAGRAVDLTADFHVYAVEWEPGELRFYLDDAAEPYYRVTRAEAPVSDHPMCVILNLAVGGWFDGNPDETTRFPQHFDVDYVRVYQRPAAAAAGDGAGPGAGSAPAAGGN